MLLRDRTALITGGSSGIGLATADLFVAHGARVAITGRDPDRLAAAAARLGPAALPVRADVRSADDLAAVRETVGRSFGRLDVLFANAGVASATPVDTTDRTAFAAIMDANVAGVFFTVQAMLPLMASGGSIVLNASWLARTGTAGLSVLSASKAAVRSFARTLSAELLPRGIRVNAVSPGAIDTPIHRRPDATPEEAARAAERLAARIPLGRFGAAGEVAEAVLWLAADASRYVVGADLLVDGGFASL